VQHTGVQLKKTKDKSSTQTLNLHCALRLTDLTSHTIACRNAWKSLKEVAKKVLGSCKDFDFENIVGNMLANLKALGCTISLKFHFLNSRLSYFPENLGAASEGEGKRFHQDIK